MEVVHRLPLAVERVTGMGKGRAKARARMTKEKEKVRVKVKAKEKVRKDAEAAMPMPVNGMTMIGALRIGVKPMNLGVQYTGKAMIPGKKLNSRHKMARASVIQRESSGQGLHPVS